MAHFRHHMDAICRYHLQFARPAPIVVTMIEREITGRLTSLFHQYPFVTVTGPRQSGKTTLCRAAFPNLAYANLEAPDQREFAATDPQGFLSQCGSGAILDEIQRVPALLSYLQVLADEEWPQQPLCAHWQRATPAVRRYQPVSSRAYRAAPSTASFPGRTRTGRRKQFTGRHHLLRVLSTDS